MSKNLLEEWTFPVYNHNKILGTWLSTDRMCPHGSSSPTQSLSPWTHDNALTSLHLFVSHNPCPIQSPAAFFPTLESISDKVRLEFSLILHKTLCIPRCLHTVELRSLGEKWRHCGVKRPLLVDILSSSVVSVVDLLPTWLTSFFRPTHGYRRWFRKNISSICLLLIEHHVKP